MDATPCKPFTGHINRNGYGVLRRRPAHRVAWELERGPIPPGLVIDHMCHDPAACPGGRGCPHRRCINVEHMATTTIAANAARGSKGQRGVIRGLQQRAKTHCPSGHEYTPENTRLYRGYRYCRACGRERGRERRGHSATNP